MRILKKLKKQRSSLKKRAKRPKWWDEEANPDENNLIEYMT